MDLVRSFECGFEEWDRGFVFTVESMSVAK